MLACQGHFCCQERRQKGSNGAAAGSDGPAGIQELAEQQPGELYSLTRTVEAVALERLIDKFAIKLGTPNLTGS